MAERPPRVVLDTNIAVPALVFPAGSVAAVRTAWQEERVTPLVSSVTAAELIRVLAYPKFALTADDREELLADYLPFCEVVAIPDPAPATPPCRDPFDVPFLQLAVAGAADCLVTGDRDLLLLAGAWQCDLLTAAALLARLEER